MEASARPSKSGPSATRWQHWLDEHGERFFLYARQQTRSESDAKDVFQDALTEAWRKASGNIPDRALVIATIRRRAIDLGRSIDRRSVREDSFADTTPAWFEADYSAGDTGEYLATAIRDLPDALREVLVLRIWEEMTFPAIARLTGVPTATATSRYRYALDRLRQCLTELQP